MYECETQLHECHVYTFVHIGVTAAQLFLKNSDPEAIFRL